VETLPHIKEHTDWRRLAADPSCLPLTNPYEKVYTGCAVVGNAPSILADPRTGAAIDRHEAVFRSNVADTKSQTRFTGSKTTVRLINHQHVDIMERAFQKGDDLVLDKYQADELELGFSQWHLSFELANGITSSNFLTFCSMQHGPMHFTIRALLPTAQKEYTSLYYGLRKALAASRKIQVRPGPSKPPTGFAALYMALRMCTQVHVYGFSVDAPRDAPSHYFKEEKLYGEEITRPSRKHDYQLQAQYLKMLHVAGILTVCCPAHPEDAPGECFL